MNKKIVLEYIAKSLEKCQRVDNQHRGPVVTIARQYGCPGIPLAILLKEALNDYYDKQDWQVIDKEIIDSAADELMVSSDTISKVIETANPGLLANMLSTFSESYLPPDVIVKKKVAAIITSVAEKGHVVILGRGSEIITQHMPNALHIYLVAQKAWRINRVMELHKMNSKDAENLMETMDKERIYLRNLFAGEKPDVTYYDLVFNARTMDLPIMVKSIMGILVDKGIIGHSKPKPSSNRREYDSIALSYTQHSENVT